MGRRGPVGPNDAAIELSSARGDGRRIGYATFGDPEGVPVVNCHGGLMSRNDCALADAEARALGLRLISPDRPGVGLTDRLPGHDMVDWVRRDLVPLVEALELDRFRVMGWSAGGQHALAVAHELGDRVERVAIVAGCVPVNVPANRAQLSRLDQRLLRWTDHAVALAKTSFRTIHLLATRMPERLVRLSAADLDGDEHGALAAHRRWFARTVADGSQDPSGQVDDYRAYGAPWGFRPEDVDTAVTIHHGTEDRLVPVAWAHELGRRLPNAEVTTYDGVGHLIGVTRRREILEALAAP